MSLPKPNPTPCKVEFRVERFERWPEDIFGIRIYFDGEPGAWVHWVESGTRPMKVVRSHGIEGSDGTTPCGWAGSKSQAEAGAEQLQRLYDDGRLV